VAIISVLASIAMPNYVEAQARARVSRVKADMRVLKIGLDSYYNDHSRYPKDYGTDEMASWVQLTTPLAYMETIPNDAFSMANSPLGQEKGPDLYCCPESLVAHSDWAGEAEDKGFTYGIVSPGPDLIFQWAGSTPEAYYWKWLTRDEAVANSMLYDPTNGTVSAGDLVVNNMEYLN
jgi:type II secretory pathway pseudopilin PulG